MPPRLLRVRLEVLLPTGGIAVHKVGRQVLSQIQRFIGVALHTGILVVGPGHELILFLAAQDRYIGLKGSDSSVGR